MGVIARSTQREDGPGSILSKTTSPGPSVASGTRVRPMCCSTFAADGGTTRPIRGPNAGEPGSIAAGAAPGFASGSWPPISRHSPL